MVLKRMTVLAVTAFVSVATFGGTDVERLQLTEPTFHTQQKHPRFTYRQGNLTDAADLFVEFGHKDAKDYLREMDLEDALATVKYTAGGVDYTREMFASYPDKVGAMRFTASKKGTLSFVVRALFTPKSNQKRRLCKNRQNGIITIVPVKGVCNN